MTESTANAATTVPGGGRQLPDLYQSGRFVTSIGLRLDEVTGSRVHGFLDLDEEHHTPWGVVHGGVYTTVIESVASIGASAAVLDRGEFAVGVNNNTDFLRSAKRGRAEVLAEPLHQGRSQQLWHAVITRVEDGKPLARGTVRLQNLPLESS
jgi:uncharacterized protein (TIGR00369 family)